MNTFTRKGYGRIYVEHEKQIDQVTSIIKEMDEYEFDYLPTGFITTISQYPHVVYTHKFDSLDYAALTAICWDKGIKIFCFDSGHDSYPSNSVKLHKAKMQEIV